MNNTPFDNFNNMDDIFNELMGSMNGIIILNVVI